MKFFLTLIITACVLHANCQAPIVQQNGVNVSFHSKLDSAILAATNGDTLYLPGGSFSISVPIDKRIHIFGVGHHPDSTAATNITEITNPIYVISSGSGGSVLGITVCQVIFGYQNAQQTVTNYTISRCHIRDLYLGNSSPSTASKNAFTENMLQRVNGFFSKENFFSNNLIGLLSDLQENNSLKNNIFFPGYEPCGGGGYASNNVNNVTGSLFENNIFIGGHGISNSTLNNNLFVGVAAIAGNVGSNNIGNQIQGSIFANQTGVASNYSHDYQLQSTSPGKNAGKDGTDIGIYGGAFKWKDGSLPPNPHIQQKIISSSTDQSGNLQINIKVKAQNN